MIAPTNKVACFFTQLNQNEDNLFFSNKCFELVEYWKKSWEANGWEAHVLDEEYLDKEDEYYIALKFHNWSESNFCKDTMDFHPEYTRACYLRWFAYYQFAKENGIIFHADIDAINYGVTPQSRNVSVNTMLNYSYSAGKQNSFGLRSLLENFIYVEKNPEIYKSAFAHGKTNDIHINSSTLSPSVHHPRICMAPNEELMLQRGGHFVGKGRIVDYHNGIFYKPEGDPNTFDISHLIEGRTRLEAIKILEKHFHLTSY